MQTLWQDLRYAARTLRKQPGFTVVAVLVLALGMGATTAIFSVVDAVLLKPLPFKNPERLVMVWETSPRSGNRTNVVNSWNFLQWQERSRSFERIAAFMQVPANITSGGEPQQVTGVSVTADFFPILGVAPALGRTFLPEEDRPGGDMAVVLSYGLWQQMFGGSSVLGRTIRINEASCTIIGVMPRGFAFPNYKAELWTAARLDPARALRDGRNYSTVARLQPGVTLAQAQAEMGNIAAKLGEEHPERDAKWGANVVALKEQAVGQVQTALLVLLGAVGFVLLIACANVASLLLIRATGRRREIAVRAALGARRSRIIRLLLAESLLLATAGGALGFLTAGWGVHAILILIPSGVPLPRIQEIGADSRVLGFGLLLSIVTGILFGLAPAWQMSDIDISEAFKRSTSFRLRLTHSRFLVSAEVALSLLLLVGAGLTIRSFARLESVHPGFQPEHVLTMRLLLSPSKYFENYRGSTFIEEIRTRVEKLPGVEAAGFVHLLPLSGLRSATGFFRGDQPAPPPGTFPVADISVITPGYFHTMAIPVLKGRDFELRDRPGTAAVAIINRTLANRFYPNEDPIGQPLSIQWSGANPRQIVGIVGDIRHNALDSEPLPTIFLPSAQNPNVFASLVVRTSSDPVPLAASIQAEIHAIDKDQPVADIRTMDDVLSDSVARPRFQSTLLGLFSGLSLVLTLVGIYAVMSYSVTGQTHEIGIRMALGAQPADVLKLVLREAMILTAAGLIAGLGAAFALTRYLSSLLYGITATDPGTFTGVVVLVAAVALAAAYIPARRATNIDPMKALRYE